MSFVIWHPCPITPGLNGFKTRWNGWFMQGAQRVELCRKNNLRTEGRRICDPGRTDEPPQNGPIKKRHVSGLQLIFPVAFGVWSESQRRSQCRRLLHTFDGPTKVHCFLQRAPDDPVSTRPRRNPSFLRLQMHPQRSSPLRPSLSTQCVGGHAECR